MNSVKFIFISILIMLCSCLFMACPQDQGSDPEPTPAPAPAPEEDLLVLNILSPATETVDVPINVNIVIQFNKSLDTGSQGTVSFSFPEITFENDMNCAMTFITTTNTEDTVVINPEGFFEGFSIYSGITVLRFNDDSGNEMIAYNNPSFYFMTMANTVPDIIAITPTNGSTDIPLDENIILQFSEELDSTITGTVSFVSPNITFTDGSNCTITFGTTVVTNDTVTINPDSDFSEGTLYENISISGFRNTFENDMIAYNNSWYDFETLDETLPISISISPSDNSINVSPDTNIVIQFSETLETGTFGTVSFGSPSVSFVNGSNCTITFSTTSNEDDTITVNPDADLTEGVTYSNISIEGFEDAFGNVMNVYTDAEYDISISDNTNPEISLITPVDAATVVSKNTDIVIQFNESLNDTVRGTVSFANPVLSFIHSTNCNIAFSTTTYLNDTVTVTPDTAFATFTVYSNITVSGFEDISGNAMDSYNNTNYDFRTARDIYVVGYSENSSGTGQPCYWLNGVRTDLETGAGTASAIFIDGTDVYIAGKYGGPCYWLNGSRVDLDMPGGSIYGSPNDIYVYSSTVYVVGQDNSGSSTMGCVWENGTHSVLPIGTNKIGNAYGIYVNSTDIYVAGYVWDADFDSIPCYWQNGTLNTLSGSGEGLSVDFNGSSLFVAGNVSPASPNFACYWRNGTRTNLTGVDSSNPGGTANSVYCSGSSNTYICGYTNYTIDSIAVPAYWLNGTRTDLPVLFSTYGSKANDIVAPDTVYTGGYSTNSLDDMVACYWVDDVLYAITDLADSNQDSGVNGIAVLP